MSIFLPTTSIKTSSFTIQGEVYYPVLPLMKPPPIVPMELWKRGSAFPERLLSLVKSRASGFVSLLDVESPFVDWGRLHALRSRAATCGRSLRVTAVALETHEVQSVAYTDLPLGGRNCVHRATSSPKSAHSTARCPIVGSGTFENIQSTWSHLDR